MSTSIWNPYRGQGVAQADTILFIAPPSTDTIVARERREAVDSEFTPSINPTEVHVTGKELDIKLSGHIPEWVEPVITTVRKLLALPSNWDSYGASPVSPEAIELGLKLLFLLQGEHTSNAFPAPDIVPTGEGGIQLEWHQECIDLEIEINLSLVMTYFFFNSADGIEEEGTLPQKIERVEEIIKRLSSSAG